MNITEIITLLGGITTAVNAIFLGYLAWKRLKPELKKSDAEVESELAEAANLNLEGAKISGNMLLDRINELKGELASERELRKAEVAQLKQAHEESILATEKARKADSEYFRRRIRDLDRESRDYKQWAAKLVKQVVEAGKIPAPFTPSFGESDTHITAIRPDLETGPTPPVEKDKK